MNKWLRSTLSILLAIVMLVSAIPVASTAADAIADQSGTAEAERVREIPELRRTNAETYLLSDGTYECVVHSDNVYFESENGELEPIDNTIVKTDYTENGVKYSFTNAANSSKVYFSADSPAVLIKNGDDELRFTLADSSSGSVYTGDALKASGLSDCELSFERSIMYTDVLRDADLVYTVSNGIVRACLLLKSAKAPLEYTFSYDLSNYSVEKKTDGQVAICDGNENTVFELGSAIAVDSNEEFADIRCEVIDRRDNTARIKITIDPQYLNDSNREFPVRSNLSTTISGALATKDAYASEGYPSWHSYLSTELRTGYGTSYGKCWSYIKFDIPSYVSNGVVILGKLRIKKGSGASPAVRVRRVTETWQPEDISWYVKPGAATDYSTLYWESSTWYYSTITSIVSSWVYGKTTNNGLQLRDQTEDNASQWTSFYSSDAASSNAPQLCITYTQYKDAALFGVTNSGHDHTSCLDDIKTKLEACHINTVHKLTGTFTVAAIQNYLSNGQNGVFVFRGDGNARYSGSLLTGAYIKLNNSSSNPVTFESSTSFNGLDLSSIKIALFASHGSGRGGPNSPNLASAAVSHGAKTAVGFQDIDPCSAANQWVKDFVKYLKNGSTVQNACIMASYGGYSGTGLESPVICGDYTTTIN